MEVSKLVRTLLARRGVEADDAIAAFLNPDYDAHTYEPFQLVGMDVAVERILRAMEQGERIAVYADFDCDGIPGAALLSDIFRKIGHLNFEVYIPHRDREGYGFHAEAIGDLAARGVSLIITVDVGTTAQDAVRHAHELNIDVIITDHHEVIGALPEAVAIINPKRAPYPFPNLCGTGVAFKLAQALLSEGKRRGMSSFTAVPSGWEKWLLDLVAIATVADMVPLVGENRALTHFGISVLRKSRRPGIDALCNVARLKKSELTEDDIGFTIAPRINAASRMDDPDLAFRLLTTNDANEADVLASKLEHLNASRKGIVAGIVRDAKKHVAARFTDEQVVVLGSPDWKPALLGLAANSVLAERQGVVCLWGRDANGRLKGSCRSDGTLSVVELFTAASDALEEFGGHEMSGGFSVSNDQVHALPEKFLAAASALREKNGEAGADEEHDAALSLAELSWNVFRDIAQLRPFGTGNPKPVFLINGVSVTGVKRFGKGSDHVEVLLANEHGARMRGYEFFKAPDDFSYTPKAGATAAILATLERDSYRNSLALRLVDILPSRD